MSHSFNFVEQEALAAPVVSVAQAEALVRERYGIVGVAEELGSQQDANFKIDSPSGTWVLKVSNPAFTAADIDAQDNVAAHLARCEQDIRVPRSLEGTDGHTIQSVTLDGQPTVARLVTYIEGEVLSNTRYLAPATVAALGDLAGRTSRALAAFGGAIPPRELQWDLRHADEVVSRLAEFVSVPGGAESAREAARTAAEALAPAKDGLPVQAVHGDLTVDNVIAIAGDDGRRRPVGIIDFGDLTQSWRITELAVTCSSLLPYAADDPTAILPAIRAFNQVRPISDDEVNALWPLIVLRATSLMVSGQHQTSFDVANNYASKNLDWEWRIFEAATALPIKVMTELVGSAIRPAAGRRAAAGEPVVVDCECACLDISTTSPPLDSGRFLEDGIEALMAANALTGEVDLAYVPFLHPRLTRTSLNSFDSPATVGLGVEVFVNEPRQIHAPWSGTVEIHNNAVALRGPDDQTLWLSGDFQAAATVLKAGDPVGWVSGDHKPLSLRVQVSRLASRPPFFVPAAMAEAWAQVCPDPTPLIDPSGHRDENAVDVPTLLARRSSSFAPVQEHYFTSPPQIERGWRQHLFDVDGRSYLDMVNNVAILGHGNPRLADAVERQWRLLNTNSRFHYRAVVEFSERLATLCPEPLDTVFLVNSGTEAVDLALRLAWANTGRRDVLAVREAYHGWSDATDALSTSVADNPNALGTRPAWVHSLAAPNAYRGDHRGADAHRYAEDSVAYVQDMVVAGRPPAAFLCESFYGNAGGIALPDGYLAAVYHAVRHAGGLCIADEVQVGYGRLGEHFWGFEQQNVVPDIVTAAKAMGNGHPLGAVITSSEIAAGYRSQGYFFSSAGGSPVSSVVGLTVLDVLRDEGLQENARMVGAHLRQRLLDLADRHAIIGAVHGMGLYIGVELVRDRETLEPATAETAAICERMRELGVIMQPTSDRLCVLKVKPPLGITIADADFFADALERVLTEGW
ncbi:aminotransferase [Saccharopolyspora sp. K220]|uniref:aminotransferase n=1 Tax=Saccharopolyspora soli TaxID=2926618 RepID=UPI001F564F2E|nr:aminotransferase [Saccharopolyspora soli]MCI2423865.1 aminotransferase [Saccharopolyspora soli]